MQPPPQVDELPREFGRPTKSVVVVAIATGYDFY